MNRWSLVMLLCSVLMLFGLRTQASPYPENISVGLFFQDRIEHVVLTVDIGGYDVIADGKVIYDLTGERALQVIAHGDKMELKGWSSPIGECRTLRLRKKSWGSAFKLKPMAPAKGTRIYHDNLMVSVNNGRLKLINDVWLEYYVAGVVEAEAGKGKTPEFYKVQAIICRTYALRHLNKFISEGYNLCDGVECQVYKGKSRHEPAIPLAVAATRGMVVVDSDINLITAAFHSNSGGHTMNSEHVWSKPVSYLRATPDTFSQGMPHYAWEKRIPTKEWLAYLASEHKVDVQNEYYRVQALDACPEVRSRFMMADNTVNLRTIRTDWRLRSTYFDITEEGDEVVLRGRGFGHGVGLSQEGAMRMAILGHSFTDILHYYYTDVHLVDLSVIDFFRED